MATTAPDAHLKGLTKVVLNSLENQHDWTEAKVHTQANLPRPMIYGLPPKRLYVHPDEQIAIIKAEKTRSERIHQAPEFEWVLPLHIAEKWSPAQFAAVFDAIEAIPPGGSNDDSDPDDPDAEWNSWRRAKRGKRLLLATVQDDSTVTYYFMFDGLAKPRQN